jgi:hypothetical protein
MVEMSSVESAVVPAFERRATATSNDSIRLTSCRPLQTIIVSTLTSVYELIVLDGEAGDVIIQGGSHFPELRRACFIGSSTPDSEFKVNCIEVGLRMRVCAGDRIIVTSPVQAYQVSTPETNP